MGTMISVVSAVWEVVWYENESNIGLLSDRHLYTSTTTSEEEKARVQLFSYQPANEGANEVPFIATVHPNAKFIS